MPTPNLRSEDYYEILGLARDCTENDIKKAYRTLAIKWHPDKNPKQKAVAEENFKKISEAYSTLSDASKRKHYNLYGKDTPTSGTGAASRYTRNFPFQSRSKQGGGFTAEDSFFNTPFWRRDPFSASDAFNLFESFFGTSDPFSVFENDPIFGPATASGFIGSRMGSGRDVFQSSHSASSQPGSFCRSQSVKTTWVNGKKVTRREESVTDPSGRVSRSVTEEVDDGRGGRTIRVLEDQPNDGRPATTSGATAATGATSPSLEFIPRPKPRSDWSLF